MAQVWTADRRAEETRSGAPRGESARDAMPEHLGGKVCSDAHESQFGTGQSLRRADRAAAGPGP